MPNLSISKNIKEEGRGKLMSSRSTCLTILIMQYINTTKYEQNKRYNETCICKTEV